MPIEHMSTSFGGMRIFLVPVNQCPGGVASGAAAAASAPAPAVAADGSEAATTRCMDLTSLILLSTCRRCKAVDFL